MWHFSFDFWAICYIFGMTKISIYIITNSINNKIYVGQTWGDINSRFVHHKKPTSKNGKRVWSDK